MIASTLDTLTWVDPTGVEFPLPITDVGPSGRFGPSIRRADTNIPGRPGVRRIQVLDDDAEVSAPILIEDQGDGLRAELRRWVRALDPSRGAGYVRSESPDGERRIFRSRYDSGLSFDEPWDDCQLMMLVFAAEDEPYWEDETDTVVDFTAASASETVNWFGRNWFPFTLSSSVVSATKGIVNVGSEVAYPVITVQGPGAALVVSNPDTGEDLSLTENGFVLAAHEFVTIDARPRRKMVTHSTLGDIFSVLKLGSRFPSFPPGASRLSVRMASATAASRVSVAYRSRYRSA